jgi:hypothetical protein
MYFTLGHAIDVSRMNITGWAINVILFETGLLLASLYVARTGDTLDGGMMIIDPFAIPLVGDGACGCQDS